MQLRVSRYDLSAIMRAAWETARQAVVLGGGAVKTHLSMAMKKAWADAKAALETIISEDKIDWKPQDLIGHSEDYLGRTIKYVALRHWSSKDGYDKRIYIDCEVNGKSKTGLMYFFVSGQTDFYHIRAKPLMEGYSITKISNMNYFPNKINPRLFIGHCQLVSLAIRDKQVACLHPVVMVLSRCVVRLYSIRLVVHGSCKSIGVDSLVG